MREIKKLRLLSQILIFYSLLVILWGAWVRISHSGDGCGNHWPFCQGQVVPDGYDTKTWTEYAHRLSSGIFAILVVFQSFKIRRLMQARHPARVAVGWSVFFMITEALLGAALVKLGLVADSASLWRPLVMALHLLNSLMLVGSLTLVWDFLSASQWHRRELLTRQIRLGVIIGFCLIAMSGAIAALSTTLFPSTSLWSGLMQDLNSNSHFLIRTRMLHPIGALLLGGTIAITAWLSLKLWPKTATNLRQRSKLLSTVTLATIAIGFFTLVSLSPVPLKITHLLMAYFVWINLVLWVRTLTYTSEPL